MRAYIGSRWEGWEGPQKTVGLGGKVQRIAKSHIFGLAPQPGGCVKSCRNVKDDIMVISELPIADRFEQGEITFVEAMSAMLEGFTPASPMTISPSLFVQLQCEPQIAYLMNRVRVNEFLVAQCAGKGAFSTKADAMSVLRHMRDRRKRATSKRASRTDVNEPYQCGQCGQWHLGRRRG